MLKLRKTADISIILEVIDNEFSAVLKTVFMYVIIYSNEYRNRIRSSRKKKESIIYYYQEMHYE